MSIRRADLDRIATGEVTLAFRRWRRPTVKAGGTLRTAVLYRIRLAPAVDGRPSVQPLRVALFD